MPASVFRPPRVVATAAMLLLLLVFAAPTALAAAPTFDAPANATVDSGEGVTITYTITNPTDDSLGQFSVYVSPPFNAPVKLTDVSSDDARSINGRNVYFMALEPGETATVNVTYFVKPDAEAGTYTLTGELRYNDTTRDASTRLSINGGAPDDSRGVALSGTNVTATPGEIATVEWTAQSTNNGSIASMLINGSARVPDGVALTEIRLTDGGVATTDTLALYAEVPAGTSRTAAMDYRVAENATPGTYTVTARAETNNGTTATATATITVERQNVVEQYDNNTDERINRTELLDALKDYPESVNDIDLLELLAVYEA